MAKEPAMRPTGETVEQVLERIGDDRRRADARTLLEMMRDVTGEDPQVWASRIVGFGHYRYRYDSGQNGEGPLISFAPQAAQFTIYLIAGFETRHATQVAQLGTYRAGKGCLYIKRLSDVDLQVLRVLLDRSVRVRRGVGRAAG
jgi:hypothetical protein